jgi:hypothetical protein
VTLIEALKWGLETKIAEAKLRLVTINTGALVMISMPDIPSGQPEREVAQPYTLQEASWEAIPILKEV